MRYLFLAGCARSGTTALARTLNLHPEISIGIERFKSLLDTSGTLTPNLFRRDRFLDFKQGDTFYDNLEAMPANPKQEEYQETNYLGDKSPGLYRHFEMLFNNFRNVRVLFIVRSPMSVAASWEARAPNKSDYWWPDERDATASIEEWNASLSMALPFILDGRVKPVVYEQLFVDRFGWDPIQQYLQLKDPIPVKSVTKAPSKIDLLDDSLTDLVRENANWDDYEKILKTVHPGRSFDMYSAHDKAMIDYGAHTIPGLSYAVRDPGISRTVCVGSAATFGRFIRRPFPKQIGASNYAVGGARPDCFSAEPLLLAKLAKSDVTVIEATSARGYANSVFAPVSRLTNMMELTEFGNTVQELEVLPKRFFVDRIWERLFATNQKLATKVISQIQNTWLQDMRTIIKHCNRPIILYFSQYEAPDEIVSKEHFRFPHLVTNSMLDSLDVEVVRVVSRDGIPFHLKDDQGNLVPLMNEWADPTLNNYYPSQEMHDQVASKLNRLLSVR